MKRHPRLDGNHWEIVDGLRAVGASVQSLASIGGGCPDLMVGFRGCTYAMELKDGSLPPSKRALTPLEKVWHLQWKGDVCVVSSLEEALAVIGLGKRQLATGTQHP